MTVPSRTFHKLYRKIHDKTEYMVKDHVCMNKDPGFTTISTVVTVVLTSVTESHYSSLFPDQDTAYIPFT